MLVENNETADVDQVVFEATVDVVKTHLSTQDILEGDIPQLIRDINLCFLEIAASGEDPQAGKQQLLQELRTEAPRRVPQVPQPAPVDARTEKPDEAERVSPTRFAEALANPDLVFPEPETTPKVGMDEEDFEQAFKTPPKAPPRPSRHTPKIAPEKSVGIEHIVCLEDGKSVKDLAKHLKSNHRMTPAAYRKKWKLPEEYPMIPPALLRRRGVTVEVDPATGDFLE